MKYFLKNPTCKIKINNYIIKKKILLNNLNRNINFEINIINILINILIITLNKNLTNEIKIKENKWAKKIKQINNWAQTNLNSLEIINMI